MTKVKKDYTDVILWIIYLVVVVLLVTLNSCTQYVTYSTSIDKVRVSDKNIDTSLSDFGENYSYRIYLQTTKSSEKILVNKESYNSIQIGDSMYIITKYVKQKE